MTALVIVRERSKVINRETSQNSPSRSIWNRLGFIFGIALIGLVGSWVGIQAAHPFQLAAEWRSRNDGEEREFLRLRLQNQRAEREVRLLNTREGILRSARPLGWVLPEEKPFHIPD